MKTVKGAPLSPEAPLSDRSTLVLLDWVGQQLPRNLSSNRMLAMVLWWQVVTTCYPDFISATGTFVNARMRGGSARRICLVESCILTLCKGISVFIKSHFVIP
jgi:hypothetical protein